MASYLTLALFVTMLKITTSIPISDLQSVHDRPAPDDFSKQLPKDLTVPSYNGAGDTSQDRIPLDMVLSDVTVEKHRTHSVEQPQASDTFLLFDRLVTTQSQANYPTQPPPVVSIVEVEQNHRPATYHPCQVQNQTLTIERKGCDTVTAHISVCGGMCNTEVKTQRRFPYVSRKCRSCQPDQSSVRMVTVFQPCREAAKKRTLQLTLPSATKCQCSTCFSEWALKYPAEKRRVPRTMGEE